MKLKFPKKILLSLLAVIIFAFLVFILFPRSETAVPALVRYEAAAMPGSFAEYRASRDAGEASGESHAVAAGDFILAAGESLEGDYYYWRNDVAIEFDVDVASAGWYVVYFTYQPRGESYLPSELALFLNGEIPYAEAGSISLDNLWQDEAGEVAVDRYGNDVAFRQEPFYKWITVPLVDSGRMYLSGLKFYLEAGANRFKAEKRSGEFYLKEITVASESEAPAYADYLKTRVAPEGEGVTRVEAENTAYKNSSGIIRGATRDVGVLPFSATKLKLNILGDNSFHTPGEAATWIADVPAPGYYCLTFKVRHDLQYATSYRGILINGRTPFREAYAIPFSYRRGWQNVTLADAGGEPYRFYLEPGDEITMVVNGDPFTDISLDLRRIATEITELGLDVTKLTHNNVDKGIDWDIIEYFPGLPEQLSGWVRGIEGIKDALIKLYGFKRKAYIIQDLNVAIDKIKKIEKDIDELPRRLSLLSQGPASAAQLLANHVDGVREQPLLIDAFYIHEKNASLPRANGTFFRKAWVNIRRFFQTFFYRPNRAGRDEVVVWVNRSRPYVDLIQKFSDDVFTRETGIKVKVTHINNDSKLILANSAGRGPDVALGVSAWIPHEYGMRGMLADLAAFPDFRAAIEVFHPEQLVPMIYDEKLFGLPETENFYVLLYRRDIMEKLGLDVPDTWDDVINILPVLNRYGMSFYLPLSSMASSKSFDATAPFIFQYGGRLYSDDGFSAAIDDEKTIAALTLMTDFYRQYGVPHQVPSFFNSFRQQTIPIGIADFGTYLQLINAAAEIRGLWDIALVPGIKDESGIVNRSMPGAQQAGIIFKKSKRQADAWAFLKWWMRTDTQIMFSDTILYTLGSKYLWNSANPEAFGALNWPKEHKEVILEQWRHLKEVPKIPGSYMVERELSNIWNKVIYDDVNLRSAVGDSALVINKEINRKMKEFGYLDGTGKKIREYRIPSSETVAGWLSDE